jgi:hypothetical protein
MAGKHSAAPPFSRCRNFISAAECLSCLALLFFQLCLLFGGGIMNALDPSRIDILCVL